MTLSRRRFIAISAAAALFPVTASASPEVVRWSGVALGASASLTISGLPRAEASRLISVARNEIERLEAIFSLYREDSVLARLNRCGFVEAPPFDLLQLLSQSGAIHSATNGVFDPTIQPLWALHARSRGTPDPETREAVLQCIGWKHVDVKPDAVAFRRPNMAMTLNGIAQGYVTDQVAILLRRSGVRNVLVSVGEIAANGEREPGQPWRIGLAEAGDGITEEVVALRDMAIATSSPLGTTLDVHGTAGHILDPRKGMPLTHWRQISVIHKSATTADGLSTAFALMRRRQICRAMEFFRGTRLVATDTQGSRFEWSS